MKNFYFFTLLSLFLGNKETNTQSKMEEFNKDLQTYTLVMLLRHG